jgi:hypothetical protein
LARSPQRQNAGAAKAPALLNFDIQFSEVISVILSLFHEVICDCFFLSDDQIKLLVQRFVDGLAGYFKSCFDELDLAG